MNIGQKRPAHDEAYRWRLIDVVCEAPQRAMLMLRPPITQSSAVYMAWTGARADPMARRRLRARPRALAGHFRSQQCARSRRACSARSTPNDQVRESVRTAAARRASNCPTGPRQTTFVGARCGFSFAAPSRLPHSRSLVGHMTPARATNDSPDGVRCNTASDSKVPRPGWHGVPHAPSTFTVVVTT
jgi:hypothetical protein